MVLTVNLMDSRGKEKHKIAKNILIVRSLSAFKSNP